MLRSALMLAVIAAAAPAFAEDCPVEAQREPTLRALKAAPGCAASLKILQACSWGSSQDVEFAAVVVQRCEKEFPKDMSASTRASYARAKERCRTKYANQQGTMYVSFAAHCQAEAAARFAK